MDRKAAKSQFQYSANPIQGQFLITMIKEFGPSIEKKLLSQDHPKLDEFLYQVVNQIDGVLGMIDFIYKSCGEFDRVLPM